MTIVVTGESRGKFSSAWKDCIGTGRLGLALQKEYIEHLRLVQEEIGFRYIRGHGLLHDDIGIYRELETEKGTKVFYNFTYVDRIFDTFLELGLKPFIEFGFMPKQLASGTQTIFAWEGNVTPPKDYDKWSDLIKVVTSHFIERYGEEEVLTWPFEVWNEPNLVNFWEGADKEEYFKLYQVTAEAVKEVHPNIQVGGPAICGGSDEWITDFLNFCADNHVPVDFVSRHAYTSKQPHKKTSEYYYQELAEPQKMLDEFHYVRGLIEQSPFPDLPFHITEYNTSYSPINPIHDTAVNAAYLAKILSQGGDYVDSFSYWTFSDIFEELDVPKAQFHGGFGLIGLNEVKKPTYHLFEFFNHLGEDILYRDDRQIVTKKSDGGYSIIAWNLAMEDDVKELTTKIKIMAPSNTYFIASKAVSEEYANPFEVWKQMGRPRFPSKQQVKILQDATVPLVNYEQRAVEDGELLLEVSLKRNEVRLIEIDVVNDETPTYDGLDDNLILHDK